MRGLGERILVQQPYLASHVANPSPAVEHQRAPLTSTNNTPRGGQQHEVALALQERAAPVPGEPVESVESRRADQPPPANLPASPERSPTDRSGTSEGRIPNRLATCTPRAYSAAQSFRRRDDPPQETALTTVIITRKRMGLLMAWSVPRSAEQRSGQQIRRVARQGDPAEGLRDWASQPAAPLGLAARGSVPVGSYLSEDRAVIDILGQFSLVKY